MSHEHGPPPEQKTLQEFEAAGGSPPGRDTTPAVGRRGEPGGWRRAVEGAAVALARRAWGDARWSYLYKPDTRYARRPAIDGDVPEAARRMRGGPDLPAPVNGPFINPPVWTWEVPLYFWLGGVASGSSFVALAAELAGERDSARLARKVTVAAVLPAAPLLILDLGRPLRFLNMMRIFKPRSPMSMGSWCLTGFTNAAGAAVAADVFGRPRSAQALSGATAALGLYLGSYTGVLLSATAVPVWARSRLYLAPIFVSTALGGGAAANRLLLAAAGRSPEHPARKALGRVETAAMLAELVLSSLNERRLGRVGEVLHHGEPSRLFRFAKAAVASGLALRVVRRRTGPWADHAASSLFLLAGLAFRFAWLAAGRASAADDEAVALTARRKARVAGREPL